MKIGNKYIFFLWVCLSPVTAIGQDSVWTMDACIEYALLNNFEVRQFSLRKEKAEINVKSANNLYLPSVEGRLRNNYNWGLFIDPATNILTTRNSEIYTGLVEAEWLLFNGGYNYHAVRQRKELYEAAVMDEKARKNEVTLDVMAAYFQYLYAEEQLRIARAQKELMDAQYKQIKGLVESGVLHKRELLNMESQLALNNVAITQAQNIILKSNLLLRQAMGITQPIELAISTDINDSIPGELSLIPFDSLCLNAGRSMPETKSEWYRLQAQNHTLRMAKALRYPSFSIVTGAVTKSSSLIELEQSEQFRRNLSEYVVFNLRIPIFTRFENVNRIRTEQLDVLIQENEVKRTSQEVEQKVQEAYLDLLTAHQNYWAVYRQSKALESQNELASRSYVEGIMNATEYNYINNLYNSSRLQLIQAKYEYLYKKELVNFYEGSGYCQK